MAPLRSQPTPIGRQTLITDNDIFGIFEPLGRHAQLTTKQIVAFDTRHPPCAIAPPTSITQRA
jgi:hypothetical protein